MPSKLVRAWNEYRGFALFVVLMVVFRSALADWNVVPSGSMKPTILEGDRILVNKLAYDLRIPLTHITIHTFADPKRGDIVVFDSSAADTRLVKRVIGLPGDTVLMRDNRLIINGIEARYSNIERRSDAVLVTESYPGLSERIELVPAGVSRLSPSRSRRITTWCSETIGITAQIRESTASFLVTKSLEAQKQSCSRSTMIVITCQGSTGSYTLCNESVSRAPEMQFSSRAI